MLTIVASRTTISCATPSSASTAQRLTDSELPAAGAELTRRPYTCAAVNATSRESAARGRPARSPITIRVPTSPRYPRRSRARTGFVLLRRIGGFGRRDGRRRAADRAPRSGGRVDGLADGGRAARPGRGLRRRLRRRAAIRCRRGDVGVAGRGGGSGTRPRAGIRNDRTGGGGEGGRGENDHRRRRRARRPPGGLWAARARHRQVDAAGERLGGGARPQRATGPDRAEGASARADVNLAGSATGHLTGSQVAATQRAGPRGSAAPVPFARARALVRRPAARRHHAPGAAAGRRASSGSSGNPRVADLPTA